MASYKDIRKGNAREEVRAEEAAGINAAREKQGQIEQAQQQQVGQMAQQQQMMDFQQFLNSRMATNPELDAKKEAANLTNQYAMAQMRGGNAPMNVMGDQSRMADIRGVQAGADLAQAEYDNANANEQMMEAYGNYGGGDYEVADRAAAESELANIANVERGLPNANDAAVQNPDALARFIAARG